MFGPSLRQRQIVYRRVDAEFTIVLAFACSVVYLMISLDLPGGTGLVEEVAADAVLNSGPRKMLARCYHANVCSRRRSGPLLSTATVA